MQPVAYSCCMLCTKNHLQVTRHFQGAEIRDTVGKKVFSRKIGERGKMGGNGGKRGEMGGNGVKWPNLEVLRDSQQPLKAGINTATVSPILQLCCFVTVELMSAACYFTKGKSIAMYKIVAPLKGPALLRPTGSVGCVVLCMGHGQLSRGGGWGGATVVWRGGGGQPPNSACLISENQQESVVCQEGAADPTSVFWGPNGNGA